MDVGVERRRWGWWRSAAIIAAVALGLAALVAALAGAYVAYERQGDRVAEVEARNAEIEDEHATIGAAFAKQTKELERQAKELDRALNRVDEAYLRGLLAGQRARGIPRPLRPLASYAASGFLVPRRIPRALRGDKLSMKREAGGYVLRWPGVALFASNRDPLAVWTRPAWPGTKRRVRVGKRRVLRFRAPGGVTYAWVEGGRTYALLTLRRTERSGRAIVVSLA